MLTASARASSRARSSCWLPSLRLCRFLSALRRVLDDRLGGEGRGGEGRGGEGGEGRGEGGRGGG